MYKRFLSPLLDQLDSETWHRRAVQLLRIAEQGSLRRRLLQLLCCPGGARVHDPRLAVEVAGIPFENPVMVGAGWDREGKAVRGLYELGFSGVEVGTVVQNPQEGNQKPRQFMIGPGVCLNRLGFNSPGAAVVAQNLTHYRGSGIPIGISIGKNRDVSAHEAPAAYAKTATALAEDAAYIAVNVSSPNTPGLRALQEKSALQEILHAVREAIASRRMPRPIFVKVAPDLSLETLDDVLDVIRAERLAGIIASNTTVRSDLKATYGEHWRMEAGGLSGANPEFRRMSTEQIAHIFRQTQGQLSIIGVGGISDAKSALEKIRAGASLLQVMTAIRGEGPGVACNINRGILAWMEHEGVQNLREVIGIGA